MYLQFRLHHGSLVLSNIQTIFSILSQNSSSFHFLLLLLKLLFLFLLQLLLELLFLFILQLLLILQIVFKLQSLPEVWLLTWLCDSIFDPEKIGSRRDTLLWTIGSNIVALG